MSRFPSCTPAPWIPSPALPIFSILFLPVVLACSAQDAPSDDAPASRLTLERLYRLPHLIGTAPTGFAWSADSEEVAFLWNEEGLNTRDVWTVAVPPSSDGRAPRLRRWTDLASMSPLDTAAPDEGGARVDQPYLDADRADRAEQDPGFTSVAFHPDGSTLVAARAGDIWRLEQGAEPRRWIENAGAFEFAPRGAVAAFLRRGDIWIRSLVDETERRVTEIAADGIRVSSFRWSPDGTRLALQTVDSRDVTLRLIPDYLTEETTVTEVRRAYPGEPAPRHRVGIHTLANGSTRWIDPDTPPDMILDYRWSPDGLAIALDTSDHFAKDRHILVSEIDRRSLRPGPLRELARDADPLNETFYFWRIAWSNGGERLYFLSDREQDFHLWSVDRAGGEPRQHTRGAWAVAEMTAVDGGMVVVGNMGEAEERHLLWIDEADADAEPTKLSVRPGTHAPTVSPDGSWAAVAHSSDSEPPEFLLTDLVPSRPRTEVEVTDSPIDEFDQYRWMTPQYVEFPSHVDGTTLHGRLTLPPDFDPNRTYPAILGSVYTDSVRNQWGGRTAHPTWGLDQYLVQEGYVLLNVDMRGSWGRGREHRRGIRLDYGGLDIEDLESGVRYLGSLGYVDLERVGIWGSSYGGLMTAMSLFRKPGLYAAGVAGAPATNVRHALTGQMAVMMRPQDQATEYDDSSPVLHAHGLEDPLMIVHGMRDRIVLYKDSVELVHRLIQLDKDVDLLTLPNAGHGWDNEGLAQTRFAFRKMVDYFDRHVKGDG